MSSSIESYLRTHRKRSGLRQDDIAFLLGLNGGYEVSRYEQLDRVPPLKSVFGMQVLFNALPHELYPGLYARVEKMTRQRIRALAATLECLPSDANAPFRKSFLMEIISRDGSRHTRL